MRYMGGKNKTAKGISEAMLAHTDTRQVYVEPFLGGASVMARMAPHFVKSIGSDIVPDMILLWQEVQKGTTFPEKLSREEYVSYRHAEPSAMRAFVGFGCSFGGKWFGGFTDVAGKRNYISEASRSLAKKIPLLKDVELRLSDYRWTLDEVGPGFVVYLDPPYAGTTSYSAAGKFDSEEFWKVAEALVEKGAEVFVSEFVAPDGWEEVWSKTRHSSLPLDNTGKIVVEKLFHKKPPGYTPKN